MDALELHKQEDYRRAHSIWLNIRSLIPTFVRTNSVITPTLDTTWKTVTVAAGATLVLLAFDWIGDADIDTAYFYARKYGESSTSEGIILGAGRCGGMLIQDLDSAGRFEYKGALVSGTAHLIQLGYIKFPLA
jgi:hypothetical protein